MLVSETRRQEATCLRMNWDTWGSEQLLSRVRAGGLAVSPGSRRGAEEGGASLRERGPPREPGQVEMGACTGQATCPDIFEGPDPQPNWPWEGGPGVGVP